MESTKKKDKENKIERDKRGHTPTLPPFLIESFMKQFNNRQRDIVFRMLSYCNEYGIKRNSFHQDYKNHIFTVYFFMEAITREIKNRTTLTKNGLKTLIALYYMQTILGRPVKLLEVTNLFKFATSPHNKTCRASLKYLREINFADYVPRQGFVITKKGMESINYVSYLVTKYKKQFIDKKADIKFREKHGLSNEFVYLDSK
jgi:hypothetical protein